MNITERYKYLIIDLIILFIISLLPLFWFPKGYIVTGHDAGYPINIQETFKNRLFTWNSQQNFGIDNTPNIGAIPIHAIEAALHYVGLPPARAQQFSFIFWFFLMGLSAYYLAYSLRGIIRFRFFPLITSVLYIINFFLIAIWRYGSITTFSAYCALPIIVAIFVATIQNKTSIFKGSVSISIAGMLFNGGGGLSLPLFGALLISISGAVLYFASLEGKIGARAIIGKTLLLCVYILTFSVVLNAYWLFPFIYYVTANYSRGLAANGGAEGVLVWTDSVSKYTSLINLFRLQGIPEWYDNATHPFSNTFLSNPVLIIISFIFAPLAYMALLFAKELRQKQIVLYFVLLSLVAIFFSAGTHPPTGWLFAQLMRHVPGFVIFRSAQYKFVPALYLSFAILISFTLNHLVYKTSLLDKIRKIPNQILRPLIFMGFVALILGYHWPYFRTDFFQYSPPLTTLLKVPDHVLAYDQWIASYLNDTDRTLILPTYNSSWKAAVYDWKYFSLYSLFNIIRPKPFLEHSQMLTGSQLALLERLSDEILRESALVTPLASLLGVRYALLTGDVDYQLTGMLTEDPAVYHKALSKYPEVWRRGPWQLHELKGVKEPRRFTYINSLTRYTGSEADVAGVMVKGIDNYYHYDDKTNAEAVHLGEALPVSGTIEALRCESCVMESGVNKMEIPNSLILPGSFFYTIKQWKEQPLEKADSSMFNLIINKLGLSIKRTSDIASLVLFKKGERSITETADKLSDYWDYIEQAVLHNSTADFDYSLLRKVEDYASSEKTILLKSYGESTNGTVRQRLIGIVNNLSRIENSIDLIRKNMANIKQYHPTSSAMNAELYLDAGDLSRDTNDAPILPISIEFNGRPVPMDPVTNLERVTLGTFDLNGVSQINLGFPKPADLLVNRRITPVVAFGTTNFCFVGDVAKIKRSGVYKIQLKDPSKSPEGATIYVLRKKNSFSDQGDGQVNYFTNPDVTFSINRSSAVPQDFYFTGIDGDIAATVYYCFARQTLGEEIYNSISMEEVTSPSLFVGEKVQAMVAIAGGDAEYTRVDQTKYRIHADGEVVKGIIVFNENYDRKWKLYDIPSGTKKDTGIFAFTETWFRKPIAESDHFAVNGFGNAWLLRKQPSGMLVVEYYPQQLLYKGIVVTVTGFILLVGVYIWIGKRKGV